jgi:hypothetical protein
MTGSLFSMGVRSQAYSHASLTTRHARMHAHMHGAAWLHADCTLLQSDTKACDAQTSVVTRREAGRAHGAYSDVSAVSAEMLEGTLPTRPEPSKSLRPEPSNRIPSECHYRGDA